MDVQITAVNVRIDLLDERLRQSAVAYASDGQTWALVPPVIQQMVVAAGEDGQRFYDRFGAISFPDLTPAEYPNMAVALSGAVPDGLIDYADGFPDVPKDLPMAYCVRFEFITYPVAP